MPFHKSHQKLFNFNSILIIWFSFLIFSLSSPQKHNFKPIQTISNSQGLLTWKTKEFHNFFLRSQSVFDSQQQITNEDFEMFNKLGFSGLWIFLKGGTSSSDSSLPPIWKSGKFSSPESAKSCWNEIDVLFERLAPEWTFPRLLKYFLGVGNDDLNQLTRNEFYHYHLILGFLRGPETANIFVKMQSLGAILDFLGFTKFSNTELESMADRVQITSEAIFIDFRGHLDASLKRHIVKFIENSLFNLAEGANGFKSGILKSISIHKFIFSPNSTNSLFKILCNNAISIYHFEMISTDFDYSLNFHPRPIRFSRLKTLRIHQDYGVSWDFVNQFEFNAHKNYSVLDISHNCQFYKIHDQYDYFKLASPHHHHNVSLCDFIRLNSKLKCISLKKCHLTQSNLTLKDILRPLERLEKLFIDFPKEESFNFPLLPSLKTLFIQDREGHFNWNALQDQLSNLEYLSYSGCLSNHQAFLSFIQNNSSIKKLALCLTENVLKLGVGGEFFHSLNNSTSLQSLKLDQRLIKHIEFKMVNNFKFECLIIKGSTCSKLLQYLPTMQSVKFLFLDTLDEWNLKELKQKSLLIFPNLKVLFCERPYFICETNTMPFKIVQSKESFLKDYLRKLSCLTIENAE